MNDEGNSPGEQSFTCQSIVSARTERPLVEISFFNEKPVCISPNDARAIAQNLLDAAAWAESDAAVVIGLKATGDPEYLEKAGRVIALIRESRQQLIFGDERGMAEIPAIRHNPNHGN